MVALLYFVSMRLWLRDLEWTVLLVLAAVVLLRGPGGLCYSLFLGQGRIGRWALPEVVRQWGSVAFALPGFLLGGLRGAVCGYLVSESVIFTIGMLGARRTIARPGPRLDLAATAPFLRIGLAFYASEIVISGIERSGAVLIRAVTHDYAQVGMFGVSYQIFGAAVLSTHQISSSFVPLLTVLRARREEAELRLWLERLVKWLAVVAVLGFLGALILGRDLVPLVLGRAYAPVYRNLVALTAALLFVPLTQVCGVLSLTHDRPAVLFKAALAKLVLLWGLGVPLVMRWGGFGACVAMGAAITLQAGYFIAKNAAEVGPAFRRWLMVVGIGACFVPAVWLHASMPVNVLLYGGAAGGFLLVLRALGAISTGELRAVYRALRIGRSEPDGTKAAGA
jgi:O-antigen/teichoic acid export membrane protein